MKLNSMRNLLTALLCFCSFALMAQSAQRYAYINKFKDIAISEMERAGIPASIKLAQGLLESGGGTSTLARKANNHFGIKCGGDRWTGKKYFQKDDDYDANGRLIESCFRSYKNAESSYIAHSDFLRDNPRYDFLFRLNPYDYKRWAHGLKRAGYATSATYAQKLIKVINTYDLSQYDRQSTNDIIVEDNSEDYQERLQGITRNNDVKLVLAKANETPQRISDRTRVNVRKILRFNEGLVDPNQVLDRDERVYLQPKRNSFRGQKKYHYVQAEESLYDVAQLYGVKEDKLRERNRIPDGREPSFGARIKLRGWKVWKNGAPETSRGVNTSPPVIADPVSPEDNRDNDNRPDPRPTNTGDTTVTDNPDDNSDGDDDYLPPVTGGRRPVLTSDTGERGDNYYPPEPTTPVQPDVPVNEPDPITIPSTDPSPTFEPTTPTTPPADNIIYHTVDTGDTLYNISRRYGLSVQDLMTRNGLTNTVIRKGQQLRVN